jgi:dTDP-4-amino-4,6-dideoxygalactose transaminase
VDPNTLNMDPARIEAAITPQTTAIMPVHCYGNPCDVDAIQAIADRYNLRVIYDAAHAFGAYYNKQPLGTIGDYGAISFDHTKNIHCGQGGLLLVNKHNKVQGVDYIFENGTNKRDFLSGDKPYFEWVSKGSKYYLSDLNAAFLLAQLERANNILSYRMKLWNSYNNAFASAEINEIQLPEIPSYAKHNAHIYHIRVGSLIERNNLQKYLKEKGIEAAFHFIPLHSSTYGKKVGRFVGDDLYTTYTSERLLRMPLHNQLTREDVLYVVEQVKEYFSKG